MKLAGVDYRFKLLTDCFCGGADNKGPAEVRVASIRGQIRYWYRQVKNEATVNLVWGATEGKNVGSSKVSLAIDRHMTFSTLSRILPHSKDDKKARSQRAAIPAGTEFVLTLRRLPGCGNGDWEAACDAVRLWLLVGGLGLRCNRAAGSVWPSGAWVPDEAKTFAAILAPYRQSLAFRLANSGDALTLRRDASDTVAGFPKLFGEIKPRTPSPLKIKVVKLGNTFRLLLVSAAHYPFDDAKRALSGKPIGQCDWDIL